jgi:hypothetical protein
MIVYKFRVNFEDPDDVSRDIEIKPAHTFEVFHKAIQASINYDGNGEANFFVSDDYWRKGEKISFDVLSGKKLVDFVEDPHQKFLYEYESKSKRWPFMIELVKIIDGDASNTYPRCVKSLGDAPIQFNLINPILTDEEINNESSGPEEVDDTIFYRDAEDLEGYSETEDPESKNEGFEEDSEEESEDGDFEEDAFDSASFGDEDY